MNKLFQVLILLNIVGCAGHKVMRGNVAMKVSDSQAHICMGDDEVKAGDQIIFMNNDCNQYDNNIEGLQGLCKLLTLGKGTVVKTINSHYSLVKTDGSFTFKEGTMVQKK